MDKPATPPDATVYYDGACPICTREMAQYRQTQGAERLAFVDVASCDAAALAPGLTREAALARMHVQTADGQMASGAAAFVALWRTLPRFSWMARIAGLPIVLPMLELGYRGFVRLRRLWRPTPKA